MRFIRRANHATQHPAPGLARIVLAGYVRFGAIPPEPAVRTHEVNLAPPR